MKYLAAVVAAALALTGCTTLGDIDATVAKVAPATCTGIDVAYKGYIASGHGSVRDHEVVQAAYDATTSICADPTHATAAQLAVLTVQLGILAASLKKAKKSE